MVAVEVGARIRERRLAIGISQAELARLSGVTQGTIAGLERGNARSSKHLHRIARALRTTPAYLTGETDDPDEGAPPPPAAPRLQLLSLQVALPTEDVLTEAFAAVLTASRRMDEGELARELARRLPTMLAVARGPLMEFAGAAEAPAPVVAPASARREPRRARRR